MSDIRVHKLSKKFKTSIKKEGLLGSIKGLFKREYLLIEAVKEITFEIGAGECVGLIGPNGAGKTTILKMLTGLIHPTTGEISVLGFQPWKRENIFLRNISLVMGNKFQLWWDLPAAESFELHRKIYDIPYREYQKRVDHLAAILNVSHLVHIPIRNLSLGERMKMELISSLIHNPKILFLDEPTIGLDSTSQKSIRAFLKEFNQQYGTTIIMTSHYMDDIDSVCDRLIMISKGEIIFDGSKSELIEVSQREINIHVKFHHPVQEYELQLIAHVERFDEDECVLRVSKHRHVNVIQQLLDLGIVKDLELKSLPLESIVENYYLQKLEKERAFV